MYQLRTKSSIPVFIEEDHNDVLPHIFKLVGSKYLPIENNTLVHFDSHPDLSLPQNLKDNEVRDKYVLFDRLSIENWILPACYLGVIDTIFWICPPWANQILPGRYAFKIGTEKSTGNIRVSSTESYFLSECITSRIDELENTKDVELIVYKIEKSFDVGNRELQSLIDILLSRGSCILDIDLDFFSTQNPFIELYSTINLYDRLKKIYTFDSFTTNKKSSIASTNIDMAMAISFERKTILEKLQDITSYIQIHREIGSYNGIGVEYVDEFLKIEKDIQNVYGSNEIIDWSIIHNAGCTCDDTELPHHVSSQMEIESLIQDMQVILSYIFDTEITNIAHPTVVTIARSSLDDYCPSNQVDAIQRLVEEALTKCFSLKRKLQFNRSIEITDT